MHRPEAERLLWSRDIRFVHRLASVVPSARTLELEPGTVLIAPAHLLTENLVKEVAHGAANRPEYGLVAVDDSLPESRPLPVAMAAAVQLSGLADRIGMAQSTPGRPDQDARLLLQPRTLHVRSPSSRSSISPRGDLHEYECLFRPEMPMLPQSITSVVQAAINTDAIVELDIFIVATILEQTA